MDEKRATITCAHSDSANLQQSLKDKGFQVSSVSLNGRFHWAGHAKATEKLLAYVNSNKNLRYAAVKDLTLPVRGNSGEFIQTGDLHEIAIRSILLDKALWYETTDKSLDTSSAQAICFGEERALPPTIVRKLDTRLINGADSFTSSSPSSGLSIAMAGGTDDRIAVIGMSCHVPNAEDLEEFWQILLSGESQHREVPTERFSMNSVFREMDTKRKWYGNFIRDHDAFDHKFFKKSPREMSSTDPQHRIALQLAYQAVQQSGYYGDAGADKHIGVYIGHANTDYEHNVRSYPANAYSATGNLKSLLAGKVSHYFGWTGPSLTLDTACSSSSVAIHLACRAILNGEITGALAGGVNILTSPEWYHNLAGAGFLSLTGQCKSFDSKGDGYCRGEGSGMVFLKKLSAAVADGDQILGVIASTAVLQNQNCTPITVPNSVSLAELFEGVIQKSGLKPHDITVVEAHGTGTAVGDPAEYGGIRQVLGGPSRPDRLSLTAVKGAIGHLEVASGAASLIKVLLMIHEGAVPPQASFQSINPDLNAKAEDNIDIHTAVKPWNATMRAALINNYGASGSNASMVVSEPPKAAASTRDIDAALAGKKMPFWFSGNDDGSLKRYAAKLGAFIQRKISAGQAPSIANLSFELSRQSNRGLAQSLILQASSLDDLQSQLTAVANSTGAASFKAPATKPVILCFGGQVSTFVGLDKSIFENVALLRHHLSNCDAVLTSLGLGSIYPHIFQTSPLQDIVKLQTALFALQYSCAMAWIDSGVQVAAVVGHSFGELTSLCVSGILSLQDAIQLIAKRASLVQTSWGPETGAMMAVEGDLAVVENLVSTVSKSTGKDICIACYNGPRSFTLAGSSEVIHFAEQTLKTEKAFEGTRGKVLNVTNAFHCSLVDSIEADLVALSKTLVFKQPTIHLEHASKEPAATHLPEDFVFQHLRNPVYFSQAIERLAKQYPDAVFLEAGSNSTITNMVGKTIGTSNADRLFAVNITSEAAYTNLVDTTTKLWNAGLPVTFWGHNKLQTPDHKPILLPPYQFEKARHWLEIKEVPTAIEAPAPTVTAEPEKGLINFFGVVDEAKREVRFKVNTTAPEFVKQVDSHIMAKTIGVMPGMLPVELALDAISSLRPEFRDSNYQPELQGMVYYSPLVPQHCSAVWFDTQPTDDAGMTWSWKFLSQDVKGTLVKHMTGTIVFYSPQSAMVQGDFARLSRLGSYKRCQRLLGPDGADDVVVGRNIYRAFENVIDYKDIFRHVTKLVGKDGESAARVTRSHDKDGWLDSILTDCFCQVAGISVNLFSDEGDFEHRGIYIGDRVDRWIRAPGLRVDSAKPTEWDVLAMSHRDSENAFVSDVFAFDARNGTLYEAILGIRYSNVPMVGICKALNRIIAENPAQAGYAAVSEARAVPKMTFNSPPAASVASSTTNGSYAVVEPAVTNGTNGFHAPETAEAPAPVSAGSDSQIPSKAKEILANLSGLEVDEIQNDSDLVEMGIDSLMAMELIREVDAAFKITLDTDQLMGLTDFNSFITCIGKALGVNVNGASTPQVNGNGVHTNGHTNGTPEAVNGHATNGDTNGKVSSGGLPAETVHNVFRATKAATDDFIVKYKMADYYTKVRPISTMLCAAYIVEAFEKLGCSLKSAKPGQVLAKVSYLPKHEKFMKELYKIIGPQETGLVDLVGDDIIRTTVPCPTKSADALLEEALRNEPYHAPEFKLSALTGCKLAECLTGKEDGLQIIFGSAAGRKTVSDVYAVAPLNYTWIEQASSFLRELLTRLPANGEPIRILEMGAGTGGTTATLVPMLAALGVPITYTFTDLSSSLVAAARKRFKQYPFMQFQVVNIEAAPEKKLLDSQHIILANACVHATRSLPISLRNIRQMLRSDGLLMLLEETEQLPWVDFVFGLLEGWWLFEDGRVHAQVSADHWEKDLRGAGFAHVDYTDGQRREAQVQRIIFGFASDIRYDGSAAYPITLSHAELTNATDRRRINEVFIEKYTADFTLASTEVASKRRIEAGKCLLVTGATGSLGSHIVSSAVEMSDVTRVICMNRLGTVDVVTRQYDAFKMRGIELGADAASKLKIIGTDTAKQRLGLSTDEYQELVQSVTHIVHNAWPMSLTRTTKAYEPQFQVMRNLIDLARDCAAVRPPSERISLELISSIGAVGYYPIWTGQCLAPELPTTADTALPVGYADAKIVCERMLEETLRRYPHRFRAAGVRIAQITGSRTNGYWNSIEHFSFFVKSAQLLKSLPDLPGTMSWYPVNDVADSLLDILMSNVDPYAIYQIENPSRQPWTPTLHILADELNIPTDNIIPYQDWLDKVQNCEASMTENPAKQLMSFWETHFLRMSTGPLILDTKHSREHSETMRNSQPISEELIRKYLRRWKDAGFLAK